MYLVVVWSSVVSRVTRKFVRFKCFFLRGVPFTYSNPGVHWKQTVPETNNGADNKFRRTFVRTVWRVRLDFSFGSETREPANGRQILLAHVAPPLPPSYTGWYALVFRPVQYAGSRLRSRLIRKRSRARRPPYCPTPKNSVSFIKHVVLGVLTSPCVWIDTRYAQTCSSPYAVKSRSGHPNGRPGSRRINNKRKASYFLIDFIGFTDKRK